MYKVFYILGEILWIFPKTLILRQLFKFKFSPHTLHFISLRFISFRSLRSSHLFRTAKPIDELP